MAKTKGALRDYFGLGAGSNEPVANPLKSAVSFAALVSVFDLLINWLIFRVQLSHAAEQTVIFFILCAAIMWGFMTWQKKKASRLG